jgi:hypothetical protein
MAGFAYRSAGHAGAYVNDCVQSFTYCSSIPIFLYNGCVVIAVVAVLLDDNRLITIAVAIPVMVGTDRYTNRPDPDANVFCSGR